MRLSMLALALAALTLRADEGMWTFDNLPLKQMKERYGFAPDQAWLDHARLASLHFGGGSGSFVSADGLVITNHHVGRGWIQQISGPGAKDYIKLGFVARTREEEIKVPGMTLRTLMRMENVTDRINAAVKPGMTEAQATEARAQTFKAMEAALEKETGLSFNPVTLYQGGEFWLYGYKTHRDVRLVMAPEVGIASFGGDPDNFTYPRHSLDFCLFRVYENGKPYHPEHHLAWAKDGLKAGDLTFVTGHPGTTQRLFTVAQMQHARDTELPLRLQAAETSRRDLLEFAAKNAEFARQVRTRIYGIENGLKARYGYLRGLKDAEAMKEIERKEQSLREAVAKDPKLQNEVGGSWLRIEEALKESARLAREAAPLTTRSSQAIGTALALVRLIEEPLKPEAERSKGYRTEAERKAALEALDKSSTREASSPELEQFLMLKSLEHLAEELPADHAFRKAVLAGRTPLETTMALEKSKVKDAAFRAALLKGGLAALDNCEDAAVLIARRISPMLAQVASRQERLQAVVAEHSARIAKARFAVYGKGTYPDATLTMRLTFGPVAAYPANGTLIQPFTTFHGLYDRAASWGPEAERGAWALPPRWLERKDKVDLATPFNFAHQVDIIGGNSGSPVINAKGEFAGIIFDGNIEMLPGNFYYDGKVNRGISLDGRAILEALVKVYDAPHLAAELTGRK